MSYRPSDLPNITRHLSENNNPHPKQNYEDLVNCSVCYEPFDSVNQFKLPKILPCQHTYCVQCIKNLMHISLDNKKFCCPQCQYKVENLKDPQDLPTSRIVLALIEKDSLNYQGYAACVCCRQIRNLEVCFECKLPLCVMCISKHFEIWKNDVTQNCMNAESILEDHRVKLEQVGNLIFHNLENVESIKNDIENAFLLLFQRLNDEKDILLQSLNEVKDENKKYVNLRQGLIRLIGEIKSFRETNESFDKQLIGGKMKKLQFHLEEVSKLQGDFDTLAGSNFKVLERFEKKPIPDLESKLAGNLVIKEYTFNSSRSPGVRQLQTPIRTPPSAPISQSPSQPRFPAPVLPPKPEPFREVVRHVASAPTMEPQPIQNESIVTNQDALSRWILTSHVKPQSEMALNYQPSLIASHQNYLFCMDQASFITVYERVFSMELKLKNSLKLNIPNVKSMCVNSEYLAVAYGGLKKEQLKGSLKGSNPSGIVLFKRQQQIVCSVHDKIIDKGKAEPFKSISAIAINDTHVFGLDQCSLFKIDIKTGQVDKMVNFSNVDLTHISLNDTFLTVTDSLNSTLYLLNFDLNPIRSISLKPIDKINGHLSTVTANENIIFVRNSDRQISILDSNLDQIACFNEIQARIIGFSLIDHMNSQMLVICAINTNSQFKLYGYTITI